MLPAYPHSLLWGLAYGGRGFFRQSVSSNWVGGAAQTLLGCALSSPGLPRRGTASAAAGRGWHAQQALPEGGHIDYSLLAPFSQT
jgi:hypothetical protein